jgi:hypothetical protein
MAASLARVRDENMALSRVPDALQREAVRRRAGTQKSQALLSAAWAPAQQRITDVLRCVRGKRPVLD